MKNKIEKIEAALFLAAKRECAIPEEDPRWKSDLMRAVRLAKPTNDPLTVFGSLAWKGSAVAILAIMLLSMISANFGGHDEYVMLQSQLDQSADYMINASF